MNHYITMTEVSARKLRGVPRPEPWTHIYIGGKQLTRAEFEIMLTPPVVRPYEPEAALLALYRKRP